MDSITTARLSTWHIPAARRESLAISSVARTAAVALLITLAQVVLLLSLGAIVSDAPTGKAYESLCRWDGGLHSGIVREGYPTTVSAIAASEIATDHAEFFAGYPLWGSIVRRLSGDRLSIKSSLVLASQLAAWGFWTYWLLLMRRFRAPRHIGLLATLTVALHPAGYCLVVSHSESLFLFLLLGFLYWLSSADPRRRLWALPHGIIMSATQLGGLPLAFVPLMAQAIAEVSPTVHAAWVYRKARDGREQVKGALAACRQRLRNDRGLLGRLALVGLVSSLGGLAFCAYCQWRFGDRAMYFWKFSNPHWPNYATLFCVGLSVVLLAMMASWELKRYESGDRSLPLRLPFYLCAVSLLILNAAGASSNMMQSLFRDSLTIHVLLLLALAHACGWGLAPRWLTRPNVTWLTSAFAMLAGLQLSLAAQYFTHPWVA